jgi:hypothetical protein
LQDVCAAFLSETAKTLGILADLEALGARRRGSRLAEGAPAAVKLPKSPGQIAGAGS